MVFRYLLYLDWTELSEWKSLLILKLAWNRKDLGYNSGYRYSMGTIKEDIVFGYRRSVKNINGALQLYYSSVVLQLYHLPTKYISVAVQSGECAM